MPEITDNSQIVLKSSNAFRPGGTIIADCIHEGNNKTSLLCLSNGNWNDSLPICNGLFVELFTHKMLLLR